MIGRGLTNQQITDGKGDINWVGLTITALLGVSLIIAIRESSLNIKAMKKQDTDNATKIAELEINLKNALGSKYKSL